MTHATQTTEKNLIFSNIQNELGKEASKRFTEFKNEVNAMQSTELNWRLRDVLPKGKDVSQLPLPKLQEYLINRRYKQDEKSLNDKLKQLKTISEGGELISATISVEWKRSRMWGSNPTAEARVETTKGWFVFNSGSIGGCGYDKLSTAVASCLTQCNALLNSMYHIKNERPTEDNRTIFGYGSGSGLLPSIEGGVGVSCYPKIFNTLGFEFKTTASGKSFDVYTITKK